MINRKEARILSYLARNPGLRDKAENMFDAIETAAREGATELDFGLYLREHAVLADLANARGFNTDLKKHPSRLHIEWGW